MRSVRSIAVGIFAIALVASCAAAGRGGGAPQTRARAGTLALPPGTAPRPVEAVQAVIDALDRYPLVALGESHNLAESGRFYVELARSDAFASAADAVVVEFGNARFQGLVDRYVAGEPVPPRGIARAWRDTTQVGAWDAAMYARFFAAVRAANMDRAPADRIRVVLGDPPIDWETVESEEDVRRFLLRRERFMARAIEREVLDEDRRAIVIAGLAHVERSVGPTSHPNLTQLLDRRHPGATWVIGVHLGFPTSEWQSALATWPVPSIASLDGTWIGMLPKGEGLAQDALDAMLYVGAPDALHLSSPSPLVYRDDEYWRTLRERWPLGGGGSFSVRALTAAYAGAGYPGLFTAREVASLFAFADCMRSHAVEAFPDPQLQYDAAGFYGPAIEEAERDPDYPAAFDACAALLGSG